MKLKVAIFGSGDVSAGTMQKAAELGRELAKSGATIITGACPGTPYITAEAAHKNGSEVWGFSPVQSLELQRLETPDDDISIYDKLIYIPRDFEFRDNVSICYKYRNVLSAATCDVGIIISGKWGTLNEFTNLVDMGKTVGVLTGTGNVADLIEDLVSKVHKPIRGGIVFDSSPEKLVKKVYETVKI